MVLPFRHSLSFSKIRRLTPGLGVLAVTVLYAQVAAALPEIPGEMRDVMGLECTPTCLLCHTTEAGGSDNMNAFGKTMKTQTVQAPNVGVKAVFGPEGSAWESNFDKDMYSDAAEIVNNTDPASTADTGICSDAIYGCGAQVAPGATPFVSGWGLLAALGVAVALVRQLRA